MNPTTIQVSIATAKRELSRLGNQVVYGGKRVIVASRGKPKFALVNLDELGQQIVDKVERAVRKQRRLAAFNRLDQLRKNIATEAKEPLPDPVLELRELREDRTNHIMGVVRGR